MTRQPPRMPTRAEFRAKPERYAQIMPPYARWCDGWLINVTIIDGFIVVRYPNEVPFIMLRADYYKLMDWNPWLGHEMRLDGEAKASAERPIKKKAKLKAALSALIDHVERETCQHEKTHRGGALWTICNACGRKWADDKGGFVPYTDPPALMDAKRILKCV